MLPALRAPPCRDRSVSSESHTADIATRRCASGRCRSTPGVLGSGAGSVVPLHHGLLRPHPSVSRARDDFTALPLIRRAFAVRERLGDPRDLPYFHCPLSRRAVDHAPVGSRGCPVARAPLDAKLPRFVPESPPTSTASASYVRRVVRFRCGIVRVMLRPVCLPCPPDWLPRDAVTCAAPRVLRTLSPPLWPASVAERRWESG